MLSAVVRQIYVPDFNTQNSPQHMNMHTFSLSHDIRISAGFRFIFVKKERKEKEISMIFDRISKWKISNNGYIGHVVMYKDYKT